MSPLKDRDYPTDLDSKNSVPIVDTPEPELLLLPDLSVENKPVRMLGNFIEVEGQSFLLGLLAHVLRRLSDVTGRSPKDKS